MTFTQLHSNSAGNLYIVTASNGKRLMIECGVVWSKLQKALNYDLSGIVGCLLTHEHKDHSKAVWDVMKAGVDVYASLGTIDALEIGVSRRANPVSDKVGDRLILDSFDVAFFNSYHDAAEPLLFVVKADNEFLLFATDTSHIKQRFEIPFNIIALGCSYNKEYLAKRVEAGTINEEVAKRLLTSHMEEKVAMDYLSRFCDLSKCREIHLLHMSADTINKERVKTEFEKHFFVEVVVRDDKRFANK